MSAKMSERRRAAFLKALEETGNLTLSAERAKVSRSWVGLHRKEHPEFDAGCREAVAAAKARFDGLRADGSGKPPRGWGSLDGVSLVVRGSGGSGRGRRVQIARARVRQWCPRTADRFLATLAATCNVKAACAEVGMWPPFAYNHRNRWCAFAKRWDAAVETGYARLEMGLFENAGNMFSERELQVVKRGRGVSLAQRARDEADWARRRDAGHEKGAASLMEDGARSSGPKTGPITLRW